MTAIEECTKILADSDLIYSAEEVSVAVSRVAREITEKLSETNPLFICVMNGAVPFAGQLMTQLHFPLEFDYMHVTRYGAATSGADLFWRATISTSVKDRTVLIVDDILDEGVTLAAIVEHVKALGARECYVAVATDKLNGKDKPVQADFIALEVPNRFVYGYGMDVRGFFRNLPAIYALKES